MRRPLFANEFQSSGKKVRSFTPDSISIKNILVFAHIKEDSDSGTLSDDDNDNNNSMMLNELEKMGDRYGKSRFECN